MNERLRKATAFLREYKALCEKHGLIVDSCGHCNSPWLVGEAVGPYAQRTEPEAVDVGGHLRHLVEELYIGGSGEEALAVASQELVLKALDVK